MNNSLIFIASILFANSIANPCVILTHRAIYVILRNKSVEGHVQNCFLR